MLFLDACSWFRLFRFVPVAAYAIAMLKATFHFGKLAKDIATRAASLAQRSTTRVAAWLQGAKRCICRRAQQPSDGREMKTECRIDSDDGLL